MKVPTCRTSSSSSGPSLTFWPLTRVPSRPLQSRSRQPVAVRTRTQWTGATSGATLGAGTVVVCGTTIGEHAFAAAGSVVTRDVPAHAFVAGNPARPKGWVCVCGQRLDGDLACPDCGLRHRLADGGPAAGLVPVG